MKTKLFGGFLLLVAIVIVLTIAYKNSSKRNIPVVFSPKNMLTGLWQSYKSEYWEPDSGRTLDRQRNNVTTSEGQSYTMLRAVWQDDKPTFDKTWEWTEKNLKRNNDNLFSWLYGTNPDGSLGVLTDNGGQNSASDADSDIALSLFFAYARWGDKAYLENSRSIVQDIWNQEVVPVGDKLYVAADNLEKNDPKKILINPSYLAPYAYRSFSRIDPGHDWNKVLDNSYEVIQQSIESKLDTENSSNLPPDWIIIDKTTGTIKPANINNLTTNYSYDAMRLPWRLALDYQWYQDPRDKTILNKFSSLSEQWRDKNAIYTAYSHNGQPLTTEEAPAIYGGSIGYFVIIDPSAASSIYSQKLESLYSPDTNSWKQHLNYYDANWAWFGISLYNNMLANLGSSITFALPLNSIALDH